MKIRNFVAKHAHKVCRAKAFKSKKDYKRLSPKQLIRSVQ